MIMLGRKMEMAGNRKVMKSVKKVKSVKGVKDVKGVKRKRGFSSPRLEDEAAWSLEGVVEKRARKD